MTSNNRAKRAASIIKDPQTLIDGWKCPACSNHKDFKHCPHGWDDVELANVQWLKQWMRE